LLLALLMGMICGHDHRRPRSRHVVAGHPAPAAHPTTPRRRPPLAWLVGYRRLQVRYERRADVLLGFLHLACAVICLKVHSPSGA
jgi:hypothetical protein